MDLIMPFIKKYKSELILVVLASFVAQMLTVSIPLIIQRIVDLFSSFKKLNIKKLGFVIERKDDFIEEIISNISSQNGISFEIFYQGEPRGTAHAIYSARKMLKGPTLIAFADTVFESPRIFDIKSDGCLLKKISLSCLLLKGNTWAQPHLLTQNTLLIC